MTLNEFQSTAYRSTSEMLDGIAFAWMTGGGQNSAADIDAMLTDSAAPAAHAAECIDGWGLDSDCGDEEYDDEGNTVPAASHMEFNSYSADDLTAAFARFFAERPDRIDA